MVIAGDYSLLERGDHVLVIRCWHREIIIYCVTKSPITISFIVFPSFSSKISNLVCDLNYDFTIKAACSWTLALGIVIHIITTL